MNLVLDDAEEFIVKTNERKALGKSTFHIPPSSVFLTHASLILKSGRIMLKGDTIT